MAVETWITEQPRLPAERVRYLQLDGAIHEFVFLEASRGAVEDYLKRLEELYAACTDGHPTLRFLIDGSLHWIQFRGQMHDFIEKTGSLLARYPRRPSARIAFLLRDRHRVQTLEPSGRLLRGGSEIIRCFSVTQPREAIRWLRQLE
ncbi:MAG: hypothetical protein U0694_19180 [Anaerolineae bacterium]